MVQLPELAFMAFLLLEFHSWYSARHHAIGAGMHSLPSTGLSEVYVLSIMRCPATHAVLVAQSASRPRNISPADMHRQSVTGDPLKNVTESFKSRWSAVSSKCKEISSRFTRQTNARWAGRDQQDSSADADTSSSAA